MGQAEPSGEKKNETENTVKMKRKYDRHRKNTTVSTTTMSRASTQKKTTVNYQSGKITRGCKQGKKLCAHNIKSNNAEV